jgi:redox-sensitive bicupin YhaK (pirin superfamily)
MEEPSSVCVLTPSTFGPAAGFRVLEPPGPGPPWEIGAAVGDRPNDQASGTSTRQSYRRGVTNPEVFAGKDAPLGTSTMVRRLLPNLGRRLVGAWCFIDHYGSDRIADEPGMQVPPHPHIGLQTVSWLLDGEIHHRDSLGSDALLRPGSLGLMTSGAGIAHAEQSPAPHSERLHGAQLWLALPDTHRHRAPSWQFISALPVHHDASGSITVFIGELGGSSSPALTYSPLVGADVTIAAGGEVAVPIDREFEHAVIVVSGRIEVSGRSLEPGGLLYLPPGHSQLRVSAPTGARALLLGGEPFDEPIVMWWNFVARNHDEIVAARADWLGRTDRFGDVPGFDGYRLPAPDLPPGRLRPGRPAR